MKPKQTILVVDDNAGVLTAVEMLLRPCFGKVVTLSDPNRIPAVLQSDKPDAVLLDMNFHASINNGNEGLFWLREIKKRSPSTEVVLFTAYADIDLAVRGIQEGAADFVVKPFTNEKLLASLQNACQHKKGHEPKSAPASVSDSKPPFFWGKSAAMERIRLMVEKLASTDTTLLITGESGTGKGMLAAEIHRQSDRHGKPFVTVDMGAITESLYESELFGHVKGAFTDARQDRAGKFETAHQGTLFLDEIGNLSYPLQAKLLTALQYKNIVRVGSNEPITVDVRFICATNRNLSDMVKKGEFRDDLLYRIDTITLQIPALRERKEDIEPLAKMFAERYGARYGKPGVSLSAEALNALKSYAWPGNIRELEHVMERAVIMAEGEVLGASDFELNRKPAAVQADAAESDDMRIEDMERLMIQRAIAKHGGNLSAVANALGIARQTLYSKIKKYGL
ncbi:MAG: sigma-54 dependent transcriptional regulator [Bacteroides sp.]|nr:sigma-54 dependent transcriptional regulator [Ruminococcus flavefaciens]MCM1554050.1 sigma-54 dependent transcriptional regulator [Bacteroides sp.]